MFFWTCPPEMNKPWLRVYFDGRPVQIIYIYTQPGFSLGLTFQEFASAAENVGNRCPAYLVQELLMSV